MAKNNGLCPVGKYIEQFNNLTGQTIPCGDIYQSVGLASHVQKRHPNEVGNLAHISTVISNPDYIGKHPNEPDSIELVKTVGDNIMVCVKLDSKNGYLYVASVFTISQSKLANRINSGRLVKYHT